MTSEYSVDISFYSDNPTDASEYDKLIEGLDSLEWYTRDRDALRGRPLEINAYTTKNFCDIQRLSFQLENHPTLFISKIQKKVDLFDAVTIYTIGSDYEDDMFEKDIQQLSI